MSKDEFLQKIMVLGTGMISEVKEKGELQSTEVSKYITEARQLYNKQFGELELRRYCIDICIDLVKTGLLKEENLFQKAEEIYAFIAK